MSSSSSSSSSRRNFLDSRFAIGRKEVIRISILFLVFTASCLVLYKIVHPLQRLNLTSHLSSKSPLSDLNSSEISLETTEQKIILKEILEKASTNNKTVIITTLNQAWAEPKSIFDLFLESFRIGQGTQQLLKHVVVVCLDPKAFERCSQLHLNCYQIETSDADFSGDKAYNTPDYVKMMWRRIELLIRVLEMGFNFIFTGGRVRDMLFKLLEKEDDVVIKHGTQSRENRRAAKQGMRTSKFCLHPAGDTPSACRLYDAIASLCVPVIVSNGIELPFEDVVDYRKFSVFLRSDAALKPGFVVKKLRRVKPEKILKYQKAMKEVRRYFDYTHPNGTVNEIWRQVTQKIPLIKLMINREKRMIKREANEPQCSCLCSNQTSIIIHGR